LCEHLGEAVKFNAPVTKLIRTPDGWSVVSTKEGREVRSNQGSVVYCGTAFRLAELQIETDGIPRGDALPRVQASRQAGPAGTAPVADTEEKAIDLEAFSEIRYPPVASVVLGFRREDVAHPCQGFGMLIPKIEGFKLLGTIFSSSLFPNRAPAGHLTLTSYIGGERYPELASLSPEKLYELTIQDLRVLLGVSGEPTFRHCVFYPRAIPQYNVGYGRYRDRMTDIEAGAPGLFLAGHYRDGVSLSDSIVSGCNVAERVLGRRSVGAGGTGGTGGTGGA
jgi:protoporphyrinogen oxidase